MLSPSEAAELAEAIRKHAEAQGIGPSRSSLARAAGMDPNTVGKILRGLPVARETASLDAAIGWPAGTIAYALRTGDLRHLPTTGHAGPIPTPRTPAEQPSPASIDLSSLTPTERRIVQEIVAATVASLRAARSDTDRSQPRQQPGVPGAA